MADHSRGADKSRTKSGRRGPPRREAGRGLDEVLHYFISEEEQADARSRTRGEARESAEPTREVPAAAPRRPWLAPLHPQRPLLCARLLELAHAAAREGPIEILVSFPPPRVTPESSRVSWRQLPAGTDTAERGLALQKALAGMSSCGFVGVPPRELAAAAAALGQSLAGVLVLVDGSSRGLAAALGLLRELPRRSGLPIRALILGASAPDAAVLAKRLRSVAERQLELELHAVGTVPRDPADDRALLAGVPVLEQDPDAESARALAEVAERLRGEAVE